jgi:hypothetical protein
MKWLLQHWDRIENKLFWSFAKRRWQKRVFSGPPPAAPPRPKPLPAMPITIFRSVEEIEAELLASLEVVPCAICASDIAAGIPAERTINDPVHCDGCHYNWPTRIELGTALLEKRQPRRSMKNPA